jgi:hypothetical protein
MPHLTCFSLFSSGYQKANEFLGNREGVSAPRTLPSSSPFLDLHIEIEYRTLELASKEERIPIIQKLFHKAEVNFTLILKSDTDLINTDAKKCF